MSLKLSKVLITVCETVIDCTFYTATTLWCVTTGSICVYLKDLPLLAASAQVEVKFLPAEGKIIE